MRGMGEGACTDFESTSVADALNASALKGDCQVIADMAATYERLSAKTNKSTSTRQCAAQYAMACRQKYVSCMASKGAAGAPVVTAVPPADAQTTTVPTVTPAEPQGILDSLINTLMPSASPQPTVDGAVVVPGPSTGTIVMGVAGVALLAAAAYMLLGRKRGASSSTSAPAAAPASAVTAAAAATAPTKTRRWRAGSWRRPRRRAPARRRRTVRRRTSRRSYTRVR
jgi:hypothetical protein